MDIFRWIKREWDTTQSCKRRDSEPPIARRSACNYNSPRSCDEAYIRALKKFNEWRRKERSGSFRNLPRRPSKKSASLVCSSQKDKAISRAPAMKQTKTPEDDNDDSHVYEELRIHPKPRPKTLFTSAKKLLKKSQSFPANTNNYSEDKFGCKSAIDSVANKFNCPAIDENDVEKFESEHCISTEQINLEHIRGSPPRKFFRDNSNPFREVKSPVRINRYNLISFSASNQLLDDFVRDSLPKDSDVVEEVRRSSLKTINKSTKSIRTKKYDFNPSAIYENDDKVNRVGQTALYQTVMNRHGELVDYAIPFNDQNDEEFSECDDAEMEVPKITQVTSNLSASTFPLIETNKTPTAERRMSKSLVDLNKYVEHQRRNVVITDLDKSDEHSKDKVKTIDIFDELESLKAWSSRVSSPLVNLEAKLYDIKNSSNLMCRISDISQRKSALKSTMQGPIVLSSGNFRKTTVSLRKVQKPFLIQSEHGLMHELDVLEKIKHPNVTLLMAVCLDKNDRISSLVLEPFISNINCLIYDSNYTLVTEDCIEYILQVIKAVIYLHENGLIHSNICSHNILVCENTKVVKLSAFELTTQVDVNKIQNDIIYTFYGSLNNFNKSILKPIIKSEGWSALILKQKIPDKFLPYLVEYRKLYSEYYYQAPELLSSTKHFVFPTKQADVYSIALLLWEMLNSCVPYAIFSYEEMENLLELNENNQLPLFESDRCKLFQSLLQNGLTTIVNGRIDNVQSLKFLIDEARVKFKSHELLQPPANNQKKLGEPPKIEKHFDKNQENQITTTFKNNNDSNNTKRNVESDSNIQRPDRISQCKSKYGSRSLDDILQADAVVERKKGYQFQIEDFSLPSTPIARKNKLRRNAWLSNKTLYQTSFNESEEDAFVQLNNKSDKTPISARNKQINVNIKIIQNKIEKTDLMSSPNIIPQSNDNILDVSSQIEYWNSIASPCETSLKKQNNTELDSSNANSDVFKTPEGDIENDCPKGESTPTSSAPVERRGFRKFFRDRAKYYPNMPELLSETFLRRSYKADQNFESTLWRKEKERCERPNLNSSIQDTDGVERPLRTSVKDTVNKFELFTKRDKVTRNISLRSLRSNSGTEIKENASQSQPIAILDTSTTALNKDNEDLEEKISTTMLNVNLKKVSSPKSQFPKQSTISPGDSDNRKVSQLIIPPLQSAPETVGDSRNGTTAVRNSKPTLFSINIRKLNRRASDIGCVRKIIKRENSLRHSICGTDLLKNVAKMNIKAKPVPPMDNNLFQKPAKSVTSLTESDIQHCKMTCWKCGSKVFKLDEIAFNEKALRAKRFLRRFSISPVPSGNSNSVSQRIYPTSSAEEIRSIEDIYIDDDFGSGQGSLGANIRLLTPEQDDLFDILSIDFLSTDFFEPIE